MSRRVKAGSVNESVVIRIIDSTDGTPETGVVWDTAGIDLQYRRELAASVAITEATLAALTTAHADGGFLHIGNGYYRLDLPDAAVADGVTGVLVHGVVTGMIVIGEYIELVDYDPYDGTRLGLTALPNAAADAVGGLPISDAGGLDLDAKLANTNEVTAARMAALTDWINGGRLDLILDIIAVDVAGLDGAAMVGTDGAALASAYTAARAAYLDELAAANIPADVDTVKAAATEARLAELDAANIPADVDGIKTVTDAQAATGSGLSAMPWNAAWDAQVQSEVADALVAYGLATKAEMDAAHALLATAAVATEARLAELDAANLPADVDEIKADTNELQVDDVPGLIAALNDISVADILTTALADAYAANGVAPTLQQALMAVHQVLMAFAITGTSNSVKKLDSSTEAFVVTLDDATNPVQAIRS